MRDKQTKKSFSPTHHPLSSAQSSNPTETSGKVLLFFLKKDSYRQPLSASIQSLLPIK